MESRWTVRVRSKGLESGSDLEVSLAVRSPSEMVTSVAIRVVEPGVRNRARLQNGVW